MTLLLAVLVAACRKEEQAVEGVAQHAVTAEHQAQATATEKDKQRAALALVPLPTKSLYVDVHEPGAWANPFLSVDADRLTLRITMADANPSTLGQGTMLRPEAARRQEVQLRPGDLAEALVALPPGAWQTAGLLRWRSRPWPAVKTGPRFAGILRRPSSS